MAISGSAPEWRVVQDFPDYEVSSEGVIRRLVASRRKPRHYPAGYVICQTWAQTHAKSGHGYLVVKLSHGTHFRQKTKHVHHVVCEAFHGPRPSPAHEAAHGDRDTRNNRENNLRWATSLENQRDRDAHGTNNVGEAHGRAKLTDATASEAIALLAAGHKGREIARRLGVSDSIISVIKNGKSWTHLPR